MDNNNTEDKYEQVTFKNVEFNQREKEIFCNLVRRYPSDSLPEFIFEVLGDKALLFFELFHDENIKIPSFEELKNNIIDSKVLAFFEKENELDKDPYAALGRWLGVSRRKAINRINDIKIKIGEYNCLSYEKAILWDKERKRYFREKKKAERLEQEQKEQQEQQKKENQQEQLEILFKQEKTS